MLKDALAQARQNGVVIYGRGNADPELFEVLAGIAELLAEHPQRAALRQRVVKLLIDLGGVPYTTEQLATPEALSISYIAAPVFDLGQAMYELALGPLQDAVSVDERNRYIDEIRATAEKLSS